MYCLEITFHDGVSKPEALFLRRPQALIGASDIAHVVIDDLKSLGYQIRLLREKGRRFRCKVVGGDNSQPDSSINEGPYENDAEFSFQQLTLHITALDSDLIIKDNEPPDRAGVRILREACSKAGPLFPAILLLGTNPMVISFSPDKPVFVGRSNQCAVRLDSANISAQHARIGFEGGEFWVEDLGSTNGTFVDDQQISGRVSVAPGKSIVIGSEVAVVGVVSEDQISQLTNSFQDNGNKPSPVERSSYPALVCVSQVARPARVAITNGTTYKIGRDPTSDMWLGAPHVSRMHCSVDFTDKVALVVRDHSTNGTAFDDGILKRGDELVISDEPKILDFGGGVTVAICFNSDEEHVFLEAQGSPNAFSKMHGRQTLSERTSLLTGADAAIIASKESGRGFLRDLIKIFSLLSVREKFVFLIVIIFCMLLFGVIAVVLAMGFLAKS